MGRLKGDGFLPDRPTEIFLDDKDAFDGNFRWLDQRTETFAQKLRPAGIVADRLLTLLRAGTGARPTDAIAPRRRCFGRPRLIVLDKDDLFDRSRQQMRVTRLVADSVDQHQRRGQLYLLVDDRMIGASPS